MRIVILGSGNVATVLGRLFKSSGHSVVQVYSRNVDHAMVLAWELQAIPTNDYRQIIPDANLYVAALSDTALYTLSDFLVLKKGLLVHTAGSVPIQALEKSATNHGVLYPLQSLRKDMKIIPEIPFFIEANTADDLCLLEEFALTLSSSVTKTDSTTRMKWHIGAVMVSNFTNMLYTVADDYCRKEGFDFLKLKPLILETANRIGERPVAELQTGPAVRNDRTTIEKHLAELQKSHPELASLYEYLSEATSNWFNKRREQFGNSHSF